MMVGEGVWKEYDIERKREHNFSSSESINANNPFIITSIFELLEMEVFYSILICDHK